MAVDELRVVLTVSDFGKALEFFRDTLGLTQEASWENDGGHGVLLTAGRATLEIFDEAQAAAVDAIEVGRRVSGQVRLAVKVEDSASLARELEAAGAQILGGPRLTPWGDQNVRAVGPDQIQLTLFSMGGSS